MNKLNQLRDVVDYYTCSDSKNDIPDHYYVMMIEVWKRMNDLDRQWDKYHAASMLLCTVVRDGYILKNQLTDAGDKALDWANNYIEDTDVAIIFTQYNNDRKK